eukprot:TRINITY_DN1610_c0_g1_i2.p1 TRINITY_DN1610_c0_g1~~TRINITY_DN1610_c0_g1_i2.p1  ORF type:complete len:136 (-),score=33.53 TRINITY_DN1610_c0_g1_i2:73-480(-)
MIDKSLSGESVFEKICYNGDSVLGKIMFEKYPELRSHPLKNNNYLAIHYAAEHGYDEFVKIFCASEFFDVVNAQETYSYYTPLHYAVFNSRYKVVSVLLKSNELDKSVTDEEGYSPYYYSIVDGDQKMSKLLQGY